MYWRVQLYRGLTFGWLLGGMVWVVMAFVGASFVYGTDKPDELVTRSAVNTVTGVVTDYTIPNPEKEAEKKAIRRASVQFGAAGWVFCFIPMISISFVYWRRSVAKWREEVWQHAMNTELKQLRDEVDQLKRYKPPVLTYTPPPSYHASVGAPPLGYYQPQVTKVGSLGHERILPRVMTDEEKIIEANRLWKMKDRRRAIQLLESMPDNRRAQYILSRIGGRN